VNHDFEQLKIVQDFLKDGALSIDIFALRRENSAAPKSAGTGKPGPNSKSSVQHAPEGQAASLFGDVATTGNAGAIMPVTKGEMKETVIAPLDRGTVAVKRGTDALIDVVVRTRKVGHAFPGGTFDAFDVWAELQAKDENGKIIFWSGSLEWPDGPVERGAHKYRALLVDEHSNEINKRNAWAARAAIYARAIPPGAADTVHYRLHIPKDCGKRITLSAKLNYRKFSWWNTQFAFGGRPEMAGNPDYGKKGFIEGTSIGIKAKDGMVTAHWDDRPMRFDADRTVVASKDRDIPKLPITTLCANIVSLDVVDSDPAKATAPRTLDPKKDRERWNDYGIGLMLQGDFARATTAFKKVGEVAPGWPEGFVNIGRVRLLEGDLKEAQPMLEKALTLYEATPPPVPPAMVKYLRARTQFFYGMVLKNRGQYDQALAIWQQAASVFPDDRELRNQMGRVHFLAARFDESIAEFKHVLEIDPEDLTAHYNMMLCYGGKGPAFDAQRDLHSALYNRFKNDETKTHLSGPFKLKNPWDNNEAILIHEHESAPPPKTIVPDIVRRPQRPPIAAKPLRKAEHPHSKT
jgi:tetratricopeptide (TPR) repeat protein